MDRGVTYRFIGKIILVTVFGFFMSLYIMQYDARVKKKLEHQFQDLFGLFFDCSVQCNVESFRIFTLNPSITATQVRVSPRTGDGWYWSCERFTLSVAWSEILFGHKIGVKSDMFRLQAWSACHGNHVAIMDHVNMLMKSGDDFPFEFRALRLGKGSCVVQDQGKDITVSLGFDGDMGNFNKRLQAQWYITGDIVRNGHTAIDALAARVSYEKNAQGVTAVLTSSLRPVVLDSALTWTLNGSWKQGQGTCTLEDNHGTTLIDSCTVTMPEGLPGLSAHGVVPYAYLHNYGLNAVLPDAQRCADVDLTYADGVVRATLHSDDQRLGSPAGTCEYDLRNHQGGIVLQGAQPDLRYTLTVDSDNGACVGAGSLDADTNLISLNCNQQGNFQGIITPDCLKFVAKKFFGKDVVQGAGSCAITGTLKGTAVQADVALAEGAVRLGAMYNFVQSCTGSMLVDAQKKSLILKDWCVGLHRGTVRIPYARCMYDTQNALYCYLPLHVYDLFLAVERDVFALVSGRLLFVKEPGRKPCLRGTVCIDRGQVRHNIFSASEQKSVTHALTRFFTQNDPDIEVDIQVETRHPVHVKTAVLESEIDISMGIKGTVQAPQLSGTITLGEGALHFPYKSLAITHGTLYLMPYNNDDPSLELRAKGRVKRYMITMYVTGSLRDPHITFTSTPSLTQEQIVMLLVGGSEEGALGIAVPSSLMHTMHDIMFGARRSSRAFEKYVLSPLRYIRLVPSFTDQAGRGGFRGAIEIEVSDQLRAVIQKNFSLSEDTRFEVEYQAADEVTLRGLRDERSDIGGEVEMRFTF